MMRSACDRLSVSPGITGEVRHEIRLAGCRFDFAVGETCGVEVKSVTLESDGIAALPDSLTARGRKHLETLAALQDRRRIRFYFVARGDLASVRSADEIDPSYAEALRAAVNAGVEVMAMGVRFTPRGVERPRVVEVILGTRAGLGVQAGRGRVPGAQGPFLSFLLGRRAQRAGR